MIFFQWNILEKVVSMNEKLRQEVLSILLKNFSHTNDNRSIYECADDWCSKQVSTSGLVKYYKAYYNSF